MKNQDLRDRVAFTMIRYANCWEDAEVLLRGLAPAEGNKILSIGSAGDNSFSLLTTNPDVVVAVDVNQTQLFLIELKKVCIVNFEQEEALQFFGFQESQKRKENFILIKNQLTSEARAYWETNFNLIEKGLIHEGKFEKYFQLFSSKILPWIHSQKTVERLLEHKSRAEQTEFYNQKWNTWRWKLLFRIFFSKYVMGRFGRDPEFLKQVSGSVSSFIFDKAAAHLISELVHNNFMLRYTLTGNFGNLLPHYLKTQHYKQIRENISALKLRQGFVQHGLKEFGPFHSMNLSDIFEYMDIEHFKEIAIELTNGTVKDGKLAYWNLMVPRKISDVLPGKAQYCDTISNSLSKRDQGFFYERFIIDKILD